MTLNLAEIAELNKLLLASNQPGDHRPLVNHRDPPLYLNHTLLLA